MSSNESSTPVLLQAYELRVQFNDHVVLDGASLSLQRGARIGLVGRNGSGKSTFLRILTGNMAPDSGEVIRPRDLRLAYLSQEFTLDSEATVKENLLSGASDVVEWIHAFENLPPEAEREHEELESKIIAADGWHLEQRMAVLCEKLDVPDLDRLVSGLSGGEMRRVAMCRTLLSQPDLLILDEPTNHLDPESIEWVGEFLRQFPGTVLLVTHDRYFLDSITNHIVELASGRFHSYKGNYSDYLEAKAMRIQTEERTEHRRQRFLEKELEWARRGAKAQTKKSKSRLDRLDDVASEDAPEVELDMELIIPPPKPLGNRVVDLINISVNIGDRELIRNFTLEFEPGMKIGVIGRNGVGKTTFIQTLLGDKELTTGTRKSGSQVEFNYVDQRRIHLNEDHTLMQEVGQGVEYVDFGNGRLSIRAYLKRFLFADERMNVKVKSLSGGERSRLLLARILKHGGNFLVLDEPTNDLDLSTLRVLEEALIAFPGVVCVVSHDRYFLDRVCNGIIAFKGDGELDYSVGNYSYYLEKKARAAAELEKQRRAEAAEKKSNPTATADTSSGSAAAKPRKLSWNESRELESMEDKIHKIETQIEEMESKFLDPEFHLKHAKQTQEIQGQIEDLKTKRDALYKRWEELESIATAAKQSSQKG